MESCPRCCRHLKDHGFNRNILNRDVRKSDRSGSLGTYDSYPASSTSSHPEFFQGEVVSVESPSTSRLGGFDLLGHDLARGSYASGALSRLERHSSENLNRCRNIGPYSSAIKHSCWTHRVMSSEECSFVNSRSGQVNGQRFDINKRQFDMDRVDIDQTCSLLRRTANSQTEESVMESGCFGRSGPSSSSTKPDRRRVGFTSPMVSQDISSTMVPRKLYHFPGSSSSESRSDGLQQKKNKRSLRNFSCISSADVLPSLTCSSSPSMAVMPKSRVTENNRRSQSHGDSRRSRTLAVGSTGCNPRQNSNRNERLSSEVSALPSRVCHLPAQSTTVVEGSRSRKWHVVHRGATSVVSADMSTNSEYNEALQKMSITSRDSFECPPETSTCIDEGLKDRFITPHSINTVQNISETNSERMHTSRSWVDSSPSTGSHDWISSNSPVFLAPTPNSRNTELPSSFDIWNRSQPFETTSSHSSYTSSPDLNARLCSYPSINESPDSDRRLSSPEYSHGGSARMPFYRPFRRFPLRSFEENHEYFSFEEVPEILSSREHVERDEISYEHVFMLEANLLLGGMHSYDRHRDMRLDIDNMSYEDLLALEESIGSVCTGLDNEAIKVCLKSTRYCSANNSSKQWLLDNVEVKCSICQEDFVDEVKLGVLQCGHNHHLSCIEQWLQQKNECPICKATALKNSLD